MKKRIVFSSAGVFLLALVLLLALWRQDEALDPLAQQWLAQAHGSGPSQAYYQLLGMGAPAEQHAQDYGRQWHEDHWQWRATHPLSIEMPAPEPALPVPDQSLCRVSLPGCAEKLAAQKLQGIAWLATYERLLERYLDLLTLDDYRTLSEPSSDAPMPHYMALERANRLFALHIWQLAEQGQGALAQRLLEHNVTLLRAWLGRADTLILKVLLINLISHDLDTLAWLYQHDLIGLPQRQAPLSEAERSFAPALAHEFAVIARGMAGLDQDMAAQGMEDWQLQWLFKPNMSINDLAQRFKPVQARAALIAQGLEPHAAQAPVQPSSRWRDWRNAIGQVLAQVAMPDPNQYLDRVLDLNRKLALYNQLGQLTPDSANWSAERQAYCVQGPSDDRQGLRCVPWLAPEQAKSATAPAPD